VPGGEGLAERAAERAAGRRCARMSSGQGGRVGVSTDGKAAAVWCLSCACERRAKCQCLCLEGALSYERTATGSCREPEPDLRPHSARPRRRAPRWPRERASAAAHIDSPHQRPYQRRHHHHHHQQRKHQQHHQRKHHRYHQRSTTTTTTSASTTTTTTTAPTMATEAPLPVEAAAHDAPPQPEPAVDTAQKPVKRSWR
jgi:hypothetical protein